jgi:hypothetical protein
MRVFSLWDPSDALIEVDLFVSALEDASGLLARATTEHLLGVSVRVAATEDLIALKRAAGRPQDLADIAALEALRDG